MRHLVTRQPHKITLDQEAIQDSNIQAVQNAVFMSASNTPGAPYFTGAQKLSITLHLIKVNSLPVHHTHKLPDNLMTSICSLHGAPRRLTCNTAGLTRALETSLTTVCFEGYTHFI